MDSHYAYAFPHNSFDAGAFRPGVRSYPIQPIELPNHNEPVLNNAGLYNPSHFVDPALFQNEPGAFAAGGAPVHQYGNPTVHPAALHYGNVMPSQAMGGQPFVGSPVSMPNSGGIQSFSNVPRTAGFSRRSDGSNLGPSRTGAVVSSGNEPYFCRTPNSSLRQRTAQACEKCRDRKTKCSGERPICKRCSDRGMVCKWAPETRVRGHSRSKASGQMLASDLEGGFIDALPLPISALPANEEQLATDVNEASGSASTDSMPAELPLSKPKQKSRGSLSRAMAKKNLAAQRNSWPMGPPSSALQLGGMLSQTSLQLPIGALDSVDDDSWNSVWARREQQVDAAPVPGRAFDFDSLINASFDYSDGSSRGNSPPATASTSASNLSSLNGSIDSLDGLSAMLQSQLPAAEDADFTAEMYDLLNLPASNSSSSSSSGASPESGIFEAENLMDFANAAKANGGDIANEVTPVPQLAVGQDDNYMSQFMSQDFYGMMN